MDNKDALEKVSNRMKQLQQDNTRIKERMEKSVKDQEDMVRQIEKTGFKLGMQEANYYTDKQNLVKERQTKEEELKDFQDILQTNKADLIKRRDELKKQLEEVKQANTALEASKQALYGEFETKWNAEEEKHKNDEIAARRAVKSEAEILAMVKIEKVGEFLSLSTLRQFFDALAIYVSQTFSQLIEDYRTERRVKEYNNKEFVESFLKFEDRTKDLMGNKQKEFMEKTGVTSEQLGKSIQHFANQGNREVLQLYPMLASKLRTFKESDRELSKQEIIEILTLKEKTLRDEKDSLVDLMKEGGNTRLIPEQIYSVVQFRLSDKIATKLKVEEEDITKALKILDNIMDTDIQDLAVKVSEATQAVMVSLADSAAKPATAEK